MSTEVTPIAKAAQALPERPDAPLRTESFRKARPAIVGPESPEPPFPIHLSGAVQRGFGRGGKDLGCPTANLPDGSVTSMSSVCKTGVYYGYAQVSRTKDGHDELANSDSKVYPMVMSLGWNPFYKNERLTAEIHLMHDYKSDFYGHEMRALVLGYIRPELDYTSREALIEDIEIDKRVALKSLARPAYEAFALDPHFRLSKFGPVRPSADVFALTDFLAGLKVERNNIEAFHDIETACIIQWQIRSFQRSLHPQHNLASIMYNGIGLTTPRGSGTNGYVVRSLSTLRVRETPADRASAWDAAPPKHREPDQAILEHERKRKVEIKCLELQLELEEKEIDEEESERQVTALRERLLLTMAALKKMELTKMASALGTRTDYTEGDAFDKEKQEEARIKRLAEREEREGRREEERKRFTEQKEKWEQERKEKDRLRRREEDRRRREREEMGRARDGDDDGKHLEATATVAAGVLLVADHLVGHPRTIILADAAPLPVLLPHLLAIAVSTHVLLLRVAAAVIRALARLLISVALLPSLHTVVAELYHAHGLLQRHPAPVMNAVHRLHILLVVEGPCHAHRRGTHTRLCRPVTCPEMHGVMLMTGIGRTGHLAMTQGRGRRHQGVGDRIRLLKETGYKCLWYEIGSGRKCTVHPVDMLYIIRLALAELLPKLGLPLSTSFTARNYQTTLEHRVTCTEFLGTFPSSRLLIMIRSASRVARLPRSRLTLLRYTSSAAQGISSESSSKPIPILASEPNTNYSASTHPVPHPALAARTQQLLKLADEYILPVYARPPIVLEKGKGSWVWDIEGRKYLDFAAGIAVNALGHADEGVAETLYKQASKLLHASNAYHNEHAAPLAELIVTLTQREGGLGYPTEANEGALKIARKVGKERGGDKKVEIVCFEQSFHGRSLGALSITANRKYQDPFVPLLPAVRVGKLNVLDNLHELIGDKTCGVVLEPIQGEGGVNPAQVDWVREVVKRAREVGAVVIFDEIQCGLYRTGTLWAHSPWPFECHPDIVTMAKPLANGYPIGAVLMRDAVAEVMTIGTHGTTFGGSPLACALGHHVLSRLSEQAFVSHMMETSAYLIGRLSQLSGWFPELIGPTVRGRGLILGLEFKREGDPGRLIELARERGLLLLTAGKDCVRLVPSLNVARDEVAFAVDVIESCLALMGNSGA
ncbi:hypothetical protein EW146_g3234 [Bondarzewia mesenterica]|uniref:riboflavin kinase n=1 Tax=Bondarzewia mesenterica TaxID=1095465 RepID=A0A4S4LY54_9AGAM|nr:hypothetical protein EW146_g3234 [Bondarzewia mesenterica]